MRVFGEDVTLAAQAANKARGEAKAGDAPVAEDAEMAIEQAEEEGGVVVNDEVADADVDKVAEEVAKHDAEATAAA
jgi:hypothetical protein